MARSDVDALCREKGLIQKAIMTSAYEMYLDAKVKKTGPMFLRREDEILERIKRHVIEFTGLDDSGPEGVSGKAFGVLADRVKEKGFDRNEELVEWIKRQARRMQREYYFGDCGVAAILRVISQRTSGYKYAFILLRTPPRLKNEKISMRRSAFAELVAEGLLECEAYVLMVGMVPRHLSTKYFITLKGVKFIEGAKDYATYNGVLMQKNLVMRLIPNSVSLSLSPFVVDWGK
jgi:hypothetical protein